MILRPAMTADIPYLLRLRNDSATRQASRQTDVKDEKWMKDRMLEDGRYVYVAEVDGYRVGTGDLKFASPARCEVSLTIDPEHRGRHFAGGLIQSLRDEGYRLGAEKVLASVKGMNLLSLQAFLRSGFDITDEFVHLEAHK